MSFFRPNIERMTGYVPGEQPRESGFVKLNTNENPYPPSPAVLEALIEAIGPTLRLYPEPTALPVRERVARLFDVGVENVIVGNGSDDLLTIVIRCLVDPGALVAYPVPTYSLYPVLTEIQDGRTREVPFPEDFSLPPALFGSDASLTFLANPNSPTGTFIPVEEVARLAESLEGVLVVDEAYVDFADSDCMDLAKRFANVIVMRTFSKAFGLCGLRIGYAVAHERLIEGMMKVKDSYNVNRLAAVAGAAALDDIAYMRANAERIRRTRARLAEGLAQLGWRVFPSQANFVYCRVPSPPSAQAVYEALKERKVLVRHFGEALRVTVGTDEEIDVFFGNLADVMDALKGAGG